MKTITLITLFVIALCYKTTAQTDKIFFEEYGVIDGLPQESVNDIVQDEQGFIWFGTYDGLVKYDGYNFEVFDDGHNQAAGNHLGLKSIYDITLGQEGRLWLSGAAQKGFAVFHPEENRFKNYPYLPDDSLSFACTDVLILFEDYTQNLWFNNFTTTRNGIDTIALYRFDTKTESFHANYPKIPATSDWDINTLRSKLVESKSDSSIWLLDAASNLRRWNPIVDTFEIILSNTAFTEDKLHLISPTASGNLLLGGEKSIHIFDTERETIISSFDQAAGKDNRLAAGMIKYSFEDELGQIWVINQRHSFSIIDRGNNAVKTYELGKDELAFAGFEVIDIQATADFDLDDKHLVKCASSDAGIWFRLLPEPYLASLTHSLYYDYTSRSFRYYNKDFNVNDAGISTIKMFPTLVDKTGILWLAATPNLFREVPSKQRINYIPNDKSHPYNTLSDSIVAFFEDSANNRWIGTSNGLIRHQLETGQFDFFQHNPTNINSLSSSAIIEVQEDDYGHLWIRTEDGLNCLRKGTKKFERFFKSQSGESNNWISPILIDSKDRLWMNIWHKGVVVIDTKTGIILKELYPVEGDATTIPSKYIYYIREDKRGNIWMGDWFGAGLFQYTDQDQQVRHYAQNHEDSTALANNNIGDLYIDQQKQLWIPTVGYIQQFDYESNHFIYHEIGGTDRNLSRIQETENGQFWISTFGEGLLLFDPRTKEIELYDEQKGLLYNDIWITFLDDAQRIYLPTLRGLSVFDTKTKRFTNFSESDGYYADEKRWNGFYQTKDGIIWLTVNKKLHQINPEVLMNRDTTPPEVFIKALGISDSIYESPDGKIFKVAVPFTKVIELQHFQNDLTFEFVGLHYADSKKNQYSWKLENFDSDWSKPTKVRRTRYNNLNPGKYNFRVKASNADGIWNEEGASMQVTILPPWWKTWWAYLLWGSIIFILIYTFYQFQLRRRLAEAEANQIKALDIAKTRLYTNITHEFRTPLTVILGMADQIKTTSQQQVQAIKQNGRQLLQLVNQMLALSKLESGKEKLNLQQGEIIAFLKYLLESFHSFAELKNLELRLACDVEELYMDYDAEKLQQVISNLISNAIKFTPEGVWVRLRIERQLEQLHLEIADNGAGIEAENLAFIFDRYYQVENVENTGSGIGLTLVKEYVQLFDGSIDVQSELGKGTTFFIQLPIRQNAHWKKSIPDVQTLDLPLASSVELVETTATSDRSELLLVEDNKDVQQYLSLILSEHYNLSYANDGQEGTQKALANIPDLIISDVMMPRKNGYELCAQLKKDERTSHVPIILLTAKADFDSKMQGLGLGADVYLNKPFQKQELLIQVHRLLEQRKRLQAHYRQLAMSPTKSYQVAQIEESFLYKAQKAIEEHLDDPEFGIEALCKALYISRTHLYRKLKALTGKSIAEYIRSVRLHRGKDLLSSTNKTVSEIAFAVGFSSSNYFSRSFAKEFGLSPKAFREQNE
ncbi:MAG: ATP-binding protein [Bacteroidota bacterium]